MRDSAVQGKMKGLAMKGIGRIGWIEKDDA